MKLLPDQNLLHKLVERISDIFPESKHIKDQKLDQANDMVVWQSAKEHGFSLVTQDSDFFEIAMMQGAPPKVIWLRSVNSSTNHMERLISDNALAITHFLADEEKVCLEIL
jgi:predicted nuclease of predicted toxin-antitoxin system